MSCSFVSVLRASGYDDVPFDPFSFRQGGLAAPASDVGRCQFADALVLPEMVVAGDEAAHFLLKIARLVAKAEPDPVLERCCQRSIFVELDDEARHYLGNRAN